LAWKGYATLAERKAPYIWSETCHTARSARRYTVTEMKTEAYHIRCMIDMDEYLDLKESRMFTGAEARDIIKELDRHNEQVSGDIALIKSREE